MKNVSISPYHQTMGELIAILVNIFYTSISILANDLLACRPAEHHEKERRADCEERQIPTHAAPLSRSYASQTSCASQNFSVVMPTIPANGSL